MRKQEIVVERPETGKFPRYTQLVFQELPIPPFYSPVIDIVIFSFSKWLSHIFSILRAIICACMWLYLYSSFFFPVNVNPPLSQFNVKKNDQKQTACFLFLSQTLMTLVCSVCTSSTHRLYPCLFISFNERIMRGEMSFCDLENIHSADG